MIKIYIFDCEKHSALLIGSEDKRFKSFNDTILCYIEYINHKGLIKNKLAEIDFCHMEEVFYEKKKV